MIGPLPYIGGKRRIARHLIALMPPHRTYVEPFAGGAHVFFQKPASPLEVLNDIDDEIVNFLRTCQRHPLELARLLKFAPASRRIFVDYQQQPTAGLTEIERAARFFYLQKNAWGGRYRRQNFRYAITHSPNYTPSHLPKRLLEVAARLERVQLEALSYETALEQYDRPTTLFYCDPPYVDLQLYRHNFSDAQFVDLAHRLSRLKGKFLLSINDCQKARDWFAPFEIRPVRFTYTALKHPRAFTELIVANYPLDPPALDSAPPSRDSRTTHALRSSDVLDAQRAVSAQASGESARSAFGEGDASAA